MKLKIQLRKSTSIYFWSAVSSKRAAKYHIEVPDPDEEGEKLIYFCPMAERWSEIRVNIFFIIYKSYINACRIRKEVSSQESLDKYVKNKTRKRLANMQAKEAENIMEGDVNLNSSVEDHIDPVKNPLDPNDNAI